MPLSRCHAARWKTATTVVLLVLAAAAIVGWILYRRVHIDTHMDWAIAIYRGDTLTRLAPADQIATPILSAAQITDVAAAYIADPFALDREGRWYLFFEIFNQRSGQGDIGLATSDDGRGWRYRGVVLDEPFHLSFPYVFEWEGEIYVLPESAAAGELGLYRATDFPGGWERVATLLRGRFADSAIFRHGGRWWVLTCGAPWTHDTLRVFWADSLRGPYSEHRHSPVIRGDPRRGRPGGRVIEHEGHLVWFAQDCASTYGKLVRAFEITRLDTADFAMVPYLPRPVVGAQRSGWNRHGMHHVDPYWRDDGTWLAFVDGYKKYLTVRIEY